MIESNVMWRDAKSDPPPNQNFKLERRRYMVYIPSHMGYVYRCWYKNGFGCDSVGSMASGATHYRVARKGEKCRQLSGAEMIGLQDEVNNDLP
ncbi:unnamed protein product [marine sediment metagenome]|uniref:Uncharacterized protein n=1 Tax=marine sediment metagenome TaxID=412755 RepID=X0XCG5_9ZZZZ